MIDQRYKTGFGQTVGTHLIDHDVCEGDRNLVFMLSDTELGHVQLRLEATFPVVTLVDPLIPDVVSGFVLHPSLFNFTKLLQTCYHCLSQMWLK